MLSPTAASTAVGMRSIRAMTAAPSAMSRMLGSRAKPSPSPTTPMRRYIATNASNPARPQTTLCSRRTGMPRSDARSAFSALACSAMPVALHLKKLASAMSTSGTTITTRTSLPSNTAPEIENVAWKNGG